MEKLVAEEYTGFCPHSVVRAAAMRTVMVREKHKQRLYLLLAAVAALIWFYYSYGIPGFGRWTYLIVDTLHLVTAR